VQWLQLLCFYSIYDFAFNGIVILSKACIDSVRNDENDDIYSRIIDHNKIIDSFPKEDWINEISSMKQLINNCYNKKIWPIIELIEE
jgi:hypothetical protein